MKEVVFLTGSTGFVGGNLLLRLLRETQISQIILLVRSNSEEKARQRVLNNLRKISPAELKNLPIFKIKIICGDITKKKLGIPKSIYIHLAKSVTHIIHSAANVSFSQSYKEAYNTNYLGTKNLLYLASLAKNLGDLQNVAYIGTAFVSGLRKGNILESDLIEPKEFANAYEHSKFETEKLVRSLMNSLPITIFKPSIIVGDSKTGITSTFNALYYPLKLICRGYIKVIPGSRNTYIDVVPINFVVDSIFHILFNNKKSPAKFII